VINDLKFYQPKNSEPQYSAYVTFQNEDDAAFAVLGLFELQYQESLIRCSYGSTKYCLFFLRNKNCLNKDCLFQHSEASAELVFNKNETNNQIFLNHKKMAENLVKKNAGEKPVFQLQS